MSSKIFIIIAIICFGLVALAWFIWLVTSEIRLPEWLEDTLGWLFLFGVHIGVVSLMIGLVMFVLDL